MPDIDPEAHSSKVRHLWAPVAFVMSSTDISQPQYYDPHDRHYLLKHCRPPPPRIHEYIQEDNLEQTTRSYATRLIHNIENYALRVTTNLTHAQHIAPVAQYMAAAPSRHAAMLADADAAADQTFANMPSVPFTTLIYSSDRVLLFLYVGLRPLTIRRHFTLSEFKSCADITADAVAQSKTTYLNDGLSVSL